MFLLDILGFIKLILRLTETKRVGFGEIVVLKTNKAGFERAVLFGFFLFSDLNLRK